MKKKYGKAFLALLAVMAGVLQLHAQGTAFTYQGRLNDANGPASGIYDLRFAIYDAASLGAQQGYLLTNSPTAVTNGLFTVTLDFGNQFNGASRWLEIAVRTNGSDTFATLAPRQALTPTPYALFAPKADHAALADAILAPNIVGTMALFQLPSSLLTNNAAGVVLGGVFGGNGAALTNVDAASLGGLTKASFWQTSGNSGTASGINFLGTTDNQELAFRANNTVGLRLLPGLGHPSVVGGDASNFAAPDCYNTFIGGGIGNWVSNATYYAAIGSGSGNRITKLASWWPDQAVIGGGINNTNAGYAAVIPGGEQNFAYGQYSFAAGLRAKAMHEGAFVWADTTAEVFNSTTNNQFLIRAAGGVGIGKNNPATALDVNGTITATGFSGNGNGLTNLSAARLTGTVPLAQLPAGVLTNAGTGVASTAMGSGTTASGDYSTALGASTTASGWGSTALGYATIASNFISTALGFGTVASGWDSTAMGFFTTASGTVSTALGNNASATHDNSFVWADGQTGPFTSTANNEFSVRAGGGVRLVTSGAGLTVDGQPVLTNLNAAQLTGTIPLARLPASVLTNGSGASGFYSTALGYGTTATGYFSTALGGYTTASGHYSTALGYGTIASSINSTAMGYNTTASGSCSTAMGESTTASGEASTALGYATTASGTVSTALGSNAQATNDNSFVWSDGKNGPFTSTTSNQFSVRASGGVRLVTSGAGLTVDGQPVLTNLNAAQLTGTIPLARLPASVLTNGSGASGLYSTALGTNTMASGQYSTAMGVATKATNSASTALGGYTTASGQYSTAMGYVTTASGYTSTAMGAGTTASGADSTAMGNGTTASGDFSTALGSYTTASATDSTAMGAYASATNYGSFVWSDHSTGAGTFSTNNNSVTMRAAGGYRLFSNSGMSAGVSLAANGTAWAVISDRNVKKDFAAVDSVGILEKLAAMPVTQWHYNWEDASVTPHIGPMAQDFKAAFYPGTDDKSITTLEFDGVELAAIQGLNQKLEQKETEIAELKARLDRLEKLLTAQH